MQAGATGRANDSMTASAIDHDYMARALRLAERGLFTTTPNPRVGCVIVHGDVVVGEGWHERAGDAHAEVHALRAAGMHARGATAYVTLEPCAHYGRTPPCVDALLGAGIARVVAATVDPFPAVAGDGLRRLRDAGVDVVSGVGGVAARELNRGFFSRIERGLPWVRIKIATSVDGRIALEDGRSQWITGPAARADVHRWRARSSALLTGAGTARHDDPKLTVRLDDATPFSPPLRVVLDTRLDALPPHAALLDGTVPTLVVHAADALPAHDGYARAECVAIGSSEGRIELAAVLRLLADRGINELQVEAGGTLAGALLADGLVDEVLHYIAPRLLGDRGQAMLRLPPPASIEHGPHLALVDQRQVGDDMRLLWRPVATTA